MTTMGRSFCWPCKHYQPPDMPPGMISGEWSSGTCAAFPNGIPSIIAAGGFDHRQPHMDDGGVQFERTDESSLNWSDARVDEFLDRQLANFQRRQQRLRSVCLRE